MPRLWLLVLSALVLCGCSFREPAMQCSDPARKIPAIKAAAEANDASAEKQLVSDLDNDDPAVRFFAISALERLTGRRLGYEYYYERRQRVPALERWEAWLAERQGVGPATQPAGKSLVISH